MTEASHQMTSNPLAPGKQKPGSVGVSAGPEVAIMSETDANLLAVGKTGEIVIRGENVTRGYANNPEANARSFTNGWFRTGDQGYMDEEGYLHISGRLKEIINRAGEKISPREVDEVLLDHAGIKQVVTFGVPHPTLGEEVAAAVVLIDPSLSAQDIRAFGANALADYKLPKKIVILDEIPKGPTGKLQRIGLGEKLNVSFEFSDAEKDNTPPANILEKILQSIWQRILGREDIGTRDRFLDLGGDSMLAARLVENVSEETGVEITLLDFNEAPTIQEQAHIIATKLSGNGTASPEEDASHVLIYPYNGTGAPPPFYFISASTMDSFIFAELAKGLGTDRPLIGLAPKLKRLQQVEDSISVLAEEMLATITATQEADDVYLGGNCSGGIIAYEVAQRLHQAGKNVKLLVLAETYGLGYPQHSSSIPSGLLHIIYLLRKHADTLAAASSNARGLYLCDLINRQKKRLVGIVIPQLSLASETLHYRVGKDYTAQPYSGDILLLKAQHQPIGINADKQLGWGDFATDNLSVIEVPGYHGGLFSGERAKRIGHLIGEHIQKRQG
jgi:thioesterase domain-containing protein/acyl carrier protein